MGTRTKITIKKLNWVLGTCSVLVCSIKHVEVELEGNKWHIFCHYGNCCATLMLGFGGGGLSIDQHVEETK